MTDDAYTVPDATTLAAEPRNGTPPAALAPGTFAARLYLALAPLAQWDDDNGWALLILCNALGLMYQPVEDLVRDTDAGPGFSELLDINRSPDSMLPWLAQLVGVRLLPGSTPAEQRTRILSTDGFRRGTPAAMIGAAQATLTGSKRVDFRERSGGPLPAPQTYAQLKAAVPTYAAMKSTYADYAHAGGSSDYAYYLQVFTYTSETPDFTATQNALLSQKPGGLMMSYDHMPGQTYAQVKSANATYAVLKASFRDYLAVTLLEP